MSKETELNTQQNLKAKYAYSYGRKRKVTFTVKKAEIETFENRYGDTKEFVVVTDENGTTYRTMYNGDVFIEAAKNFDVITAYVTTNQYGTHYLSIAR